MIIFTFFPNTVVVIGIVGAFHGGKSFLMNQLLDKTSGDGFKVGPKIDPETHGVWGWIDTESTFADGRTVIVLDTEGFFTSSSNDMYDARLFSITSLVSSVLIYNTIKIIDNTQIDYLELLAKRTQLFSLKKSILHEDNYQDMDFVSFPPLCTITFTQFNFYLLLFVSLILDWVVRDFVQDLGSETATEWLKRNVRERRNKEISGIIMDDAEQEEFSLTTLFNDTECFTLFYPSTDPEALRDLNAVSRHELTKEWNDGISDLKKSLSEKIRNIKSSKISNGADLFNYLQVLVEVSQGKSFPAVPSVWKSYVERLVASSFTDAKKYFIDTLRSNIRRNIYTPEEFENMTNGLEAETVDRFKSMLFGLEYIYSPHVPSLREYMNREKESFSKENTMNAEKACRRKTEKLKIDAKEDFIKIELPISRVKLDEKTKAIMDDYNARITSQIGMYENIFPDCGRCIMDFNIYMESIKKDVYKENTDSYTIKIGGIIEESIKKYKLAADSLITMNVLPKRDYFESTLSNVRSAAETSLSNVINETDFESVDKEKAYEYENQLRRSLDIEYASVSKRYSKKVSEKGRMVASNGIKEYKRGMIIVSTEGPFSLEDFENLHTKAYNVAFKYFTDGMEGYLDPNSEKYTKEIDSFKRSLNDQRKHFSGVNIDRHTEKFDSSLKEVTERVLSHEKVKPSRDLEKYAKGEASKVVFDENIDQDLKDLILDKWYKTQIIQSTFTPPSGSGKRKSSSSPSYYYDTMDTGSVSEKGFNFKLFLVGAAIIVVIILIITRSIN